MYVHSPPPPHPPTTQALWDIGGARGGGGGGKGGRTYILLAILDTQIYIYSTRPVHTTYPPPHKQITLYTFFLFFFFLHAFI